MSYRIYVKTKDLSRQQWLQYRTRGIGGSDVSIIAGINPFKSIYELWQEKTHQVQPSEGGSESTHFGTLLEPIVRKEFSVRTGLKVRQKHMILQSIEYPFMFADLDGVINENGEQVIFEAKTASAFKKDVWDNGVPLPYILQVQHYMCVTGAKKTYIAALVGGNQFYCRTVERDENLIQQIVAMEKAFWENNVIGNQEPLPDGSAATTQYLNHRFARSNGQAVSLPDDLLSVCEEYNRLVEQIDELTVARDCAANRMKHSLGENEIGLVGDYRISWKQVNSTRFDSTRFKHDNPELYDQYATRSQYRKFSVS